LTLTLRFTLDTDDRLTLVRAAPRDPRWAHTVIASGSTANIATQATRRLTFHMVMLS
jgi:hypothetical protein